MFIPTYKTAPLFLYNPIILATYSLEHVHRNTLKILTRKAASFEFLIQLTKECAWLAALSFYMIGCRLPLLWGICVLTSGEYAEKGLPLLSSISQKCFYCPAFPICSEVLMLGHPSKETPCKLASQAQDRQGQLANFLLAMVGNNLCKTAIC